MKKKTLIAVLAATMAAIVTALVLTACAGGAQSKEPESEIILSIKIWVGKGEPHHFIIQDEEGNKVFPRGGGFYKLKPNETFTLPLKNGKYTIVYQSDFAKKEKMSTDFVPIELNFHRVKVVFKLGTKDWITKEFMGSGTTFANLDASVNKAFAVIDATLVKSLKPNAAIAIFPVTAASADYAEMALEGLTKQFVNSGKYTIVEKRRVEELLAEYDFQLSGLVGEKTLGELLGADAVVFSTLTDDGQLNSWAVDTSKRATLAKSVPEQKQIPIVVYPTEPPKQNNPADYRKLFDAWLEEIKEIAKANPAAPFSPRPKTYGYDAISDSVLMGKWDDAKRELRKKSVLTIFQITGGSNNEAETITSFLANNNLIQNNYTVVDRSGDTEFTKYAGSLASLTGAQKAELERMTDMVFTGTVQQIGRKNMLILNTYTPKGIIMRSFEYADSLELWVKMQWEIVKILKADRGRSSSSTGYIYSQFGSGVNRAEAEMLTQFLISDTMSIPVQKIVVEFRDATREIEAGERVSGSRFNFNWSRSGNRNRLDVTTSDNKRYSMEYGSQQEFVRKLRGLSIFVITGLGSQIQGFEGYDLANAPDPARVPDNFTKLTRVVTKGGVPTGGFYIGNAPVTQREYETVMRTNPSFTKNPTQPVNNVSIIDAMIFCNQMSIRHGLEPAYLIEDKSRVTLDSFATGYRLATSDEWRYALDKIEGLGVLLEYVYDGEWLVRYAGAAMLMQNILAQNGRFETISPTKAKLDGVGEDTAKAYKEYGWIDEKGWAIPTPVIRLVRPILDYWKFTSELEKEKARGEW